MKNPLYKDWGKGLLSPCSFATCASVEANSLLFVRRINIYEARYSSSAEAGFLHFPRKQLNGACNDRHPRQADRSREGAVPEGYPSQREDVGVIKRTSVTRPSGYENQPRLGGASRWSRTGKEAYHGSDFLAAFPA